MGKFNSYLLGRVTKSVGNVTMCYMRGQNVVKAKIFSRKDNQTPEVLAQRAKMKVLIQLSRCLLPIVRKGFVGIGKGTSSNAFVSRNMGAVSVDEKYVVVTDFKLLKVASGLLYTPKVVVTYDADGKQYSFQQEMQEEEDGYAFTDDRVYAVLYETELNRAKLVTLKNRGESGNTTFKLPEDWSEANVKAYSFATLKNGKMASDSRNIEIA